MTSYAQIHAAYVETDLHLSVQESAAPSPRQKLRWATLRRFNDHAYFVLLFAQLEQHVNDRCDQLINRRRAKAKWSSRRPWDSLDLARMDFMRKVAILTDKSQQTYARVKGHYKIRNDIAHGESAAVGPIILSTIAKELQNLAKALRAI